MITGIYMVDGEIMCIRNDEESILYTEDLHDAVLYLAQELSRAKRHIRQLEEFTGIKDEI